MADPTKVYEGGIPQGGYDSNIAGAGFSVSSEGESGSTPGGPANRPGVVNQGGSTPGKTYSKEASQDFLLDSNYKTDKEVGRPNGSSTVNPNDISHADSC